MMENVSSTTTTTTKTTTSSSSAPTSPPTTMKTKSPRRLRNWRIVFINMQVLLLVLQVAAHATHMVTATISTSIDLTTNFTPLSKTASTVTSSRQHKAKLLHSPVLAANENPPAPVNPQLPASFNEIPANGNSTPNENQHTLVAISSKSYISPPSTQQPKQLKRSGVFNDLNIQQTLNELRNRTDETERHSKFQGDSTDHLPDSSGHIPYRIGRPHVPVPPSPPLVVDYEPVPYHAGPYDVEKWHKWDRDYKNLNHNTTRVQHIEAECQDDYMKIRIGFNGSFSGLIYSAGYAYDPDCMYVNGSGRDYYEFYIQLNRCGTLGKNALHDNNHKNPTNFMWNTVTVQYNSLIEEEYDEHFKVTCEYGYDFWKTVTFPFLDVEVATGNPVVFTLSPPECYMEIQNGYGIGGPRVTGPVRVGDPLTLIIYMRSKYDGFDIVVNDCYAHNGATKRIQLIDQYGCPVDDKLISRFRGTWTDSGVYETQVYAYMKTFRFTGSPALYIECDVRMCHGRCPSQPCHWRNLKGVSKREISNLTAAMPLMASNALETDGSLLITTERPEVSQSDNVNLFQSLRVLQEGEIDDENIYANSHQKHNVVVSPAHHTCLKTSTFSASIATASILLGSLMAALIYTCSRLRQRQHQTSLYDSYILHKGQID